MSKDLGLQVGVMAHVTDETIHAAQLAVAAEARGFHSVFVTEHTHVPAVGDMSWMPEAYKRLYDPLIGLAAAASLTSTIKLGTGVLVIGQREPLATAKQIASLDRLSDGRFILGTGFGWLAQELADHGVAWGERRDVWSEHLAVLRELWTTDESAYDGGRVKFGPCWSYPKPVQSNIPVWLGSGGSPRAFDRIVASCDGWMPLEGTALIDQRWNELQRVAETAGRDPDTITLTIFGSSGDPATLDGYQRLGVSHVIIAIDAAAESCVEQQLDQHHTALLDRLGN